MGSFDLSYSCNLDVDPMTFIYELDLYSLQIYRKMCKNATSTLSHVIVWQTDRQTDRKIHTQTDIQTHRLDQNYTMPLCGCGWSIIKRAFTCLVLLLMTCWKWLKIDPGCLRHEIALFASQNVDNRLYHISVRAPQGPHNLTIMKPPLNLPLKMAEWQGTSVNAFV